MSSLDLFDRTLSTEFVIVVDFEELDSYCDALGDTHIIIAKPPNFFGVGASRFCCQVIAESLGLRYCWLNDDSTSCLSTIKGKKPPTFIGAFTLAGTKNW